MISKNTFFHHLTYFEYIKTDFVYVSTSKLETGDKKNIDYLRRNLIYKL